MSDDEDELSTYVERLMRAPWVGAFLIVVVAGSEDFLQMTGDEEGVQIDFPMITGRQRGFEPRIRAAAESAGLTVVVNRGSDGSRFLDIHVKADAAAIARVCRALLRDVFGAGDDARLEFKGDILG